MEQGNKQKTENIDLKSEEWNDLLNTTPPWILKWGTTVITFFLIVFLSGSVFFRYPDVISCPVTLTISYPPVCIRAKSTGKINELYVEENKDVKPGDYLAVIENTANTEDIRLLGNYLSLLMEYPDSVFSLPPNYMKLGEIQSLYTSFYMQLFEIISGPQLKKEKEKIQLKLMISQLQSELKKWEILYVLQAPVAGKVYFKEYHQDSPYVITGQEVFYILQEKENTSAGKAFLPVERSGKVSRGQKVNIRLKNFPDREYGTLKGVVQNISQLPSKDTNSFYNVEIALPEGLLTSYRKKLPYMPEMEGTAEIITEELSLLQRLIMPLRHIFNESF